MKRILFVDDRQSVLDGLRRMLHRQREEWEMVFVGSGRDALEAMAATPFDVIVSDMKMPGMDGAELLARVHESYPGTVRIVLSGHGEMEATLRSLAVAHQFLAKPCESGRIRAVIERACDLQALLHDEKLQDAIGRVESLPTVPSVYYALTAKLADPDASIEGVAAIVQQDAALSAKMLQLVNSCFFGVGRSISNIREATSYLGMATIKNLSLATGVFRQFEGAGAAMDFSLEDEQAHALLTAQVACRILADRGQADDAFVAGMLHDIGKLVIVTCLPDQYARALEAAERDPGRPFHAIEEDVGGISHAEVGAYLLGIWGMPYPVIEAVANHHRPSRVAHDTFDVLGAAHVADALVREQIAEGRIAGSRVEVDVEYLRSVGVEADLSAWREIAAELAEASGARAA